MAPPPAPEDAASEDAPPPFALLLELPPEAAPRLLRSAALGARKVGRTRSQAASLLWLDTAEGALAAEGLIVEQAGRGPRRVMRLLPDADAPCWPGRPDAAAEEEPPAEGLVPIASFRGRRSVVPCAGGVAATLLAGQLRAVASDRPAARLRLEGAAEEVFRTARALAEDLPLLPEVASLPEAGRALATGEPVRPRRAGPATLNDARDVGEAVAGAIGHLGCAMLHYRDGALAGTEPLPVHQMRVALRRLRAILRLFRDATGAPALLRLEGELKALAGRLGPARDWDVFLGGLAAELAAAAPDEPRLALLLRDAERARAAAYAALRDALSGPEFRLLALDIAEAAARPETWRAEAPAPDTEVAGYGAAMLERRWRKLRKRGARMRDLDLVGFHALRIEAKRLRYAAELFAPLWPGKRTRRLLKRLAALQDSMGLANDAEVARGLVASLPGASAGRAWAVGLLEGWALARLSIARREAAEAFAELEKTRPFWRED